MVDKKVPHFFEKPTQVAFYDMYTERYIAGIGDGDHIICLECGGIVELSDFFDDFDEICPDVAFPVIPFSKWYDLSDACLGDLQIDPTTGEATLP